MLAKKCLLVGIFTLLSFSLAIADPPAEHPTTGEPLVIDCLRGTPDAIDGDLSDWNLEAMTPAVVDVQEQISGDSSQVAAWDGPEDCSGEFYMLWDDENIYMAVIVKDDKLSQNKTGGSIWNADAVEIFFSTTNAVAGHAEHYQYGFNANEQKWLWDDMEGAGQSEVDYLQIGSSVTADGYICEASIPYAEITPLDWSVGSIIGFHPVIDDTDDGDREIQMTWTSHIAHDQSQGFGHLFLSSDTVVPQTKSSNPNPRHGAKGVPQEVVLTWRTGEYVEGLSPRHRIFVSENFDDVNDGIGGIEQDVEFYPIDGILSFDLGKTCYWRVDEANSTSEWDTGAIWRFTVIDHLVVDDFENYNDVSPNIIYETWLDGWEVEANGSTIGYSEAPAAEQNIINSGKQAMPFFYDNSGVANYSEALRTFSPSQDWTREGVGVLSLWFKGHPPYVGGFIEDPPGTYTMTGSGTDIWSTADEFHFAFKEISGAAKIIAKVESVSETDPWAKAGVMIRNTLDADSTYAAVLVTPENGVRFQYRQTAGGITDRYFAEGITAPQWVRLERTAGGLVRAYYSNDGAAWEQFNLTQVSMDMPINIGLAVTSHNVDLTCEATFSNVSFPDTNIDMQWIDQDVGMLSNELEPMYITVGDGAGTTATVYHNDPSASQTRNWTQWNIPLMDFSDQGVIITDVSKLAIGFGSEENPQSGGIGKMYFDDIRLYQPAPPEVPEGLIGHWNFDENSGATAGDSSGNGHIGTIEGAPTWVSPGWDGTGSCMQFGGDIDRITIEPFDLAGSGITLAAWVNVITFQDDARIISKAEGSGTADHYWAMILSGTDENNLQFRLRTDIGSTSRHSAPDTEDLQLNEWTHIAVTWDAGDPVMRFYKNGQEIFSQDKEGSTVGTNPDIKIAIGNQSASVPGDGKIRPFGGLIDEVRIYNRGLSMDEIAGLAGL